MYAGFSDVIGSWKIIDTRSPRTSSNCLDDNPNRSMPSNRICPDRIRPGGCGTNPITAIDVTVLPDPDSPTIPNVSPAPTWNDTSSTTVDQPTSVKNSTVKFSTVNTGSPAPDHDQPDVTADRGTVGLVAVEVVVVVVVICVLLTSRGGLHGRWSHADRHRRC